MNRLSELDALRGIAALSVVIYHFTTRYAELYGFTQPPVVDFSLGHYGVHLFFIISGFVIFMTLDKCHHGLDFIVSRFARLFPVYWLAVIITYSVTTTFGLEDRTVSFTTMLANLTMLNGFVGIEDVDAVYWSLRWELAFYFIMFCLFLVKSLKHIVLLSFGALLLQLATLFFVPDFSPGRMLGYLLLYKYCSLFIAGIIFYLLMQKRVDWKVAAGISALCLVNNYLLYGLETAVVIALIVALFFLFCYAKLGFIVSRPTVFLGTISYSLYLIHEYIGWILMRELMALGIETHLAIGAAVLLSIILATLMTFSVEKPGTQWIRNIYKERLRTKLVGSTG